MVAASNTALVGKCHDMSVECGVYLLRIRNKCSYCNFVILAEMKRCPSLLSTPFLLVTSQSCPGNYLDYDQKTRERSRHPNKKYEITELGAQKSLGVPWGSLSTPRYQYHYIGTPYTWRIGFFVPSGLFRKLLTAVVLPVPP